MTLMFIIPFNAQLLLNLIGSKLLLSVIILDLFIICLDAQFWRQIYNETNNITNEQKKEKKKKKKGKKKKTKK